MHAECPEFVCHYRKLLSNDSLLTFLLPPCKCSPNFAQLESKIKAKKKQLFRDNVTHTLYAYKMCKLIVNV